jgi:hypothetical protein
MRPVARLRDVSGVVRPVLPLVRLGVNQRDLALHAA